MRAVLGLVTACVAIAALGGCDPYRGEPAAPLDPVAQAQADLKQRKDIAYYKAHEAVRAAARDPSSVVFGNTFVTDGSAVCGDFNAKNAFGGMAGPQSYVWVNGILMFEQGSRSRDFARLWNVTCLGKE
jgi:hypothetical protein